MSGTNSRSVFSRPGYATQFAPGTVGAAYRHFLEIDRLFGRRPGRGISKINSDEMMLHPYAWFGRRVRDTHDIWHVLTGYKADESLGEAALVAFSYAQVGGLGWAFIGGAAALKSLQGDGQQCCSSKAVWEGYRAARRPSGFGRGLRAAARTSRSTRRASASASASRSRIYKAQRELGAEWRPI